MSDNPNKVTIREIAENANVSTSTVSRVLRNSAPVDPEKRDAVLRAVLELDYRPNIFAQSLASGQSMTIGVLTQNFGSPFYDGILQGILLGMEGTDYWPLFVDGRWQPAIERQGLQFLLERRVDGIIIIGGQTPEALLAEIATRTPLLVVARELTTMPSRSLFVDNYNAAYQLTRYLLEMGHREIAHISAEVVYDETVNDIHQRLLGYQAALQDAGIEPDPSLIVKGNLLQQSGLLAVEMLFTRGRPFSAIFAANDQMAFGARLGLYRRNIRVPEDISLVGFDDESSAAYMVPPLTTARQPAAAMGQAAAAAMLALLNGNTVELPNFQAELIVRESVSRQR
ncbi:MAG: LacI family DNA-binding transcriptional regulator [Anaerolineales bacterium]|nr:LacI family DNA-binding transcriptional regulator [Anaerolineales bacterium]